MTYTADDLYALLPALYRNRDAEQGQVLRALTAVLAGQADVVDSDVAGLYGNWFIETCAPWVVPYIGDLLRTNSLALGSRLRVGPLSPTPASSLSERAYVANTIGYRRRKGTVAVLERLATDVTGWRTKAVEFFQLLATTQNVNHVRPANVRTPDLRDTAALELLDGPFDTTPHTAELRPVDLGALVSSPPARGQATTGMAASPRTPLDAGRYDIPNVGLFVWRLQDYPVTFGTARAVNPATAGFTFNPLGLDMPLFNTPRTEPPFAAGSDPAVDHLATELDVPAPLRRRALYDELEQRRQAIADGATAPPAAYFTDPTVEEPALRVWYREAATGPFTEVRQDRILICDLTQWRHAPAAVTYTPADGGSAVPLPIEVAVDPVLGRLSFPAAITPSDVRVSFAYAATGDLGGGPYDRRDGVSTWLDAAAVTFQRGVTKDAQAIADASDPSVLCQTLTDAVRAWNTHAASTPDASGVIAMMDSATYTEDLTGTSAIEVPAGCSLVIVAADWPDNPDPSSPGSGPRRAAGELSPDAPLRPHVHGNVSVMGTAPADSERPGELILDGLLVEGLVTVLAGNLGALRLIDCTAAPSAGGISVSPPPSPPVPGQLNDALAVAIDRSICGPVSLPSPTAALHVGASVVDAGGASGAIDATGTAADIQRSTVLGSVTAASLQAGNSIFTDKPGSPGTAGSPGTVVVARLQEGCVRFCAVSDDPPSQLPRRYRCQPQLALQGVSDPADRAMARLELIPAFTSVSYGDPGYAQLADACDERIRTGAEDGSEMGATSSLLQPQRETSLRACLDEYLRFGLQAGIFHVT